ncbi:MAG: hypothetical protein KatS3mg011_0176 [Acidimicrobiia bacterium]|nr:MAG: hypothetical protein KatS3mg011_0176 [Acidimicrobiia bacterium]
MADIFRRAFRAALFDRRPFQQALWEPSATADAALIVIVVGAALGLLQVIRFTPSLDRAVTFVLGTTISTLAAWLVLALATWFVGSRLFSGPGSASRRFEESQTMLKMHGLAFLPNLLAGIGGPIGAIGILWFLAAAAVGTSVALDIRLAEGGIAILVGAAVVVLVQTLLGAPFSVIGGLI